MPKRARRHHVREQACLSDMSATAFLRDMPFCTFNFLRRCLSLSLVLWAMGSCLSLCAQSIEYDIPETYDGKITKREYRQIVDAALTHIGQRYKVESVKGGAVTLPPGYANASMFYLDNLVALCIDETDRSAWPAVIDQYYGKLFGSMDAAAAIDVNNYATVREFLSIRIYNKEQFNMSDSAMVTREQLQGTRSTLMLDVLDAFRTVPRDAFDAWGIALDSVFSDAQRNVDRQPVEVVTENTEVQPGDSMEVTFVMNDDYGASYLLGLWKSHPEVFGEQGVVLAVPHKGVAILCKADKREPLAHVQFIQTFHGAVQAEFQEHPQPVSDLFYWWYEGTYHPFNVRLDTDGALHIVPPMRMNEVMGITR